MRGLCDTCHQVSELFQWAGREDLNCAVGHTAIGAAIKLYQTIRNVEQAGGDTKDLLVSLKTVIRKLSDRVRLAMVEAHATAYLQ